MLHLPFSEEREDVVLGLLGEPLLTRDQQLNLMEISLEDLGSEVGDEMLCERKVVFFHR